MPKSLVTTGKGQMESSHEHKEEELMFEARKQEEPGHK